MFGCVEEEGSGEDFVSVVLRFEWWFSCVDEA